MLIKRVLQNANIATSLPTGDYHAPFQYFPLHDIVIEGAYIKAVLPHQPASTYNCEIEDLQGALVTAGLIDCHTHLIFAGNRAHEWERRQQGIPYSQIAKEGGGINQTVKATRQASMEELASLAQPRLQRLIQEGVTTIECKTGYGLNLEDERKQLLVADQLAQHYPIEIIKTLLSAHTIPSEFKNNPDDYVNLICQKIIPTLWQEKAFSAIDIFCETVGFSIAQSTKILQTAKALGIPIKGHTEQLSNLGGSALIASFNGLSVDHIEYLDEQGIQAIKQSNTTAVLLPFAYYFLREKQCPPIDLLRQYQVPIAISTDFNPGTAPFTSIHWAMNMACVQFGLTIEEAWAGVTWNAAKALGLTHSHGCIAPGYLADLLVWDAERPVDIIYEVGSNPLVQRIFRGKNTL
ncbi:imidazolonepropionase [Pelistega ratti]|uniref:imidazolonepropionase n=1 Tax=Pelistega ratti TaxID=2652177 RepID=UPI001359D778|nr:imidazolonepropionase [Pelistega ratti]